MPRVFTRKIVRTIGPPAGTAPRPRVWPFRARRLGTPVAPAPAERPSLRAAIYARLIGDAAIVDLVGDRVAPAKRYQGEGLPALTYWIVSNVRGGVRGGQAGWARARVQFDCIAGSLAEAEALAACVEDLFDAVRFVSAGVVVRWSKQDGDRDAYAPDESGGDTGCHRIVCDYHVTYEARRAG